MTDLRYGVLDNLPLDEIGLVSNDELLDALRSVTLNLRDPSLDVGECF